MFLEHRSQSEKDVLVATGFWIFPVYKLNKSGYKVYPEKTHGDSLKIRLTISNWANPVGNLVVVRPHPTVFP